MEHVIGMASNFDLPTIASFSNSKASGRSSILNDTGNLDDISVSYRKTARASNSQTERNCPHGLDAGEVECQPTESMISMPTMTGYHITDAQLLSLTLYLPSSINCPRAPSALVHAS